jgi:hypothetical protein
VWPPQALDDRFFDGTATPRTISSRRWLAEGTVHQERILSGSIDSTRYFMGPQISILRDDNRRVTWAVTCETSDCGSAHRRLLLHKFPGAWPTAKRPSSSEHRCLIEGNRRVVDGKIEAETRLKLGTTVGGISFAISNDTVLARVDLLESGKLIPALIQSTNAGRTFAKPQRIELSDYEEGFAVIPGFTRPVVDVGGYLHVPIHVGNGKESVALNYLETDASGLPISSGLHFET